LTAARLGNLVTKKVLVQLPLVLRSSVSDIFKPSIRPVICETTGNGARGFLAANEKGGHPGSVAAAHISASRDS
jgi:hypothetical protein